MENSIRYSLKQLQEALNQKSESVILEEYLTKILAAQERTAKAVEMLVEQTKPKNVTVSSPKIPDAYYEKIAKTYFKPPVAHELKQAATPKSAHIAFSLEELEYIQGWYENALHTDMTIVPEERALMAKIEFTIAEIERRRLGSED